MEEFIDIISGIALQSEDISEDSSGTLILRGINITEGFIRHNREINRYYPKEIELKFEKYILKEKDLVLGMDGSKVGKNVALITGSESNSILIQRVARIRPLKNADIDYIFQNFFSKKFQDYVDVVNTSSGIPHISLKQIKDFQTSFPATLIEQQKIASFLSLIDERIQTQNKIIEELKLLKDSLVKKIFNQKLRFKDRSGHEFPNWEEQNLGDILSIPDKNRAIDIDKNKILTVKLHLKGIVKNENTETLSIGSTSYFIREKGQFIYGKQNLFNGAMGIIPDKYDGYLTSGDVPALNINNKIVNPKYLLCFLGRPEFYRKLEDMASGSGSKRIHESTLLKVKILLPQIEEQTKIASYILSVEKNIDVRNQLLLKFKWQKNYLLQNLFI